MSLPEIQDTLLDAWDFQGRPAIRSKTGGWASAAMILCIEAVERLTTLGIGVNLVTYLKGTMHLGNATSANTVTNFIGTSFMLCLLGGFVADTFLGRYMTIAIFATIQATGVTILTLSTIIPGLRPPKCDPTSSNSCVQASGMQLLVLYIALYLTALGTGGVKASVSGFGSDQFDETDPKERSQMTYFFNRFFFFINVGSLGAVTVLVYIQDDVGRKWGYGVCAFAIVFALLVFLSGTKRYRFKKLIGSPLTQIAAVFIAAWQKRRLELPADPSLFFDLDDIVTSEVSKKMKQRLPHTEQFRSLDKAAIKEQQDTIGPNLYNKWTLSTLTDVEEVKQIVRMLPIWATCILFWTVHAQLTTLSVAQSETMDRRVGSFQIPPASMAVFYVGGLLLTTAVYDRFVIPFTKKFLKKPNGLTPLQRIGIGLLFASFAMAVAALVEIKRLRTAHSHSPTDKTLPLGFYLLIPQYLIVGIGEALIYTGQLDFFLRECPKGMKTMSTGLLLSTLALGFFLSSVLVAIVHKVTGTAHAWIANDLNKGRLYNFYWLVAVLCALNFAVFLVFAKWYVYKDKRLAEVGIELDDEPEIPTCHA
ncbi:PREDICTED: protein NRT1/ PTR FAMILY 6.3-like [Tarenaya hassleriana]|uniref:protein NRT1/ PTR FAMILY 6.3-like n=1 Tax=Tarenaya hassleriana TaxID=28532 RepID=UPI00053C39FB|nr:PREDICTED: protein NRT1/ PTR FAMILY 6.3-like [Tarenaya hassleriana]